MSVYKAINAVQKDLAVDGITKDRKNVQQGYSFRGIDDVYNALSPLLAKHGLCILPRALNRVVVEHVSGKGTALFYVTVEVEFDFVCAEDGSKHTVKTFGEAMDSGDKATNKAMSAAYKYAAFQTFAIPTEGDNDADSKTHAVGKLESSKSVGQVSIESLTESRLRHVQGIAEEVTEGWDKAGVDGAFEKWMKFKQENPLVEEETAAWYLLDSKLRTAVKAHGLAIKKKLEDEKPLGERE